MQLCVLLPRPVNLFIHVTAEKIYPSRKFARLEEIIALFLQEHNSAPAQHHSHSGPHLHGHGERKIACMCLAVAGPVENNVANITNLVSGHD